MSVLISVGSPVILAGGFRDFHRPFQPNAGTVLQLWQALFFETLSSLSLTLYPNTECWNLRYLHHKNHKTKHRTDIKIV